MSWDQEETFESVEQFLIRELEIDTEKMIQQAIKQRLAEKQLTYEVHIPQENSPGREMIQFSDGRIFTQGRTRSVSGDDWGCDYWSFVEIGNPYEVINEYYVGKEDDPQVEKYKRVAYLTSGWYKVEDMEVDGDGRVY